MAHANAFIGRIGVATISIELDARSPLGRESAAWAWVEEAEVARAALDLHRAVRRDCRDDVESSACALLADVLTRRKDDRRSAAVARASRR